MVLIIKLDSYSQVIESKWFWVIQRLFTSLLISISLGDGDLKKQIGRLLGPLDIKS